MRVWHCLGRAAGGALYKRCHRASTSSPTLCAVAMAEDCRRQQAVVRSAPHETTLTISIVLAGQQRFLCRSKDEALEKALGRIRMNVVPKVKKRKNAKNETASTAAPGDIEIALWPNSDPNSAPLPGNTLNKDAWLPGHVLNVGGAAYDIILNPPTLEKMIVHGQPMVGFPLCAVPTMTFAEASACRWQWARSGQQADCKEWTDIDGATEQVYVPQDADLGLRLQVRCIPGRLREGTGQLLQGEPQTLLVGPVQRGPAVTAGAHRHPLTAQPLGPPGLRVVTYNILADQYVATEHAQNVLFAYCPPEFRVAEYRRPLVLQELLGFNADIICLQEVDEKAFALFLQPHLDYAGYEGIYTNKAGDTQEGSATFFRKTRYRLVAGQELSLKELVTRLVERPREATPHSQLLPILTSSASLRKNLQKVSTIAQLTVLAPTEPSPRDGPLCVVNTHLFFHPRANHIRTIHAAAIAVEAGQLIQRIQGSVAISGLLRGRTPALVFCGDLNSGLTKGMPGALELLASGWLSRDYWDWDSGRTFRFVRDTEEPAADGPGNVAQAAANSAADDAAPPAAQQDVDFRPADLAVPFQLANASSFQTPYTNYVRGFADALDHVWYDRDRLAVRREIPVPSETELQGLIPSERFPSDHLSVVFDLEWQEEQPADGTTFDAPIAGGLKPNRGGLASASSSRVFPANAANMVFGLLALRNGGVIAVPTDTLYGLAASAGHAEGLRKIYAIKQRRQGSPLAICVATAGDVAQYGEVGHLPRQLLDKLLPGPVTLLLRRRPESPLADELNPGLETIGVRVPDSAFICEMCAAVGGALALTSANLSGEANALTVEDFRGLWPQCAAIYDGGAIEASPEGSTVVDLSQPGSFRIRRRGVAAKQTVTLLESFGIQQQST